MGFEWNITTVSIDCGVRPALTGARGFDQCPAPFAGPARHPTLQIALTTPDKPLLTPQLGSVS